MVLFSDVGAGAAVTLTRAGAQTRTRPADAQAGKAPAVLTATQKAVQTALDRLGATQVGANLFLDPLCQPYPDLPALGRRIARRPSGSGSYELTARGSTAVIVKDAIRVSAGLHGTQWRLVAAFAAEGRAA